MSLLVAVLGVVLPVAAVSVDVPGFLARYGFVRDVAHTGDGPLSAVDLGPGIRAAQVEMGLPPTGSLDNATLALMASPRCGVFPGGPFSSRRPRRYALSGSRWRLEPITWAVGDYHPLLSVTYVDATVEAVMADLSAVSGLRFARASLPLIPDIRIRFVDSEHGCAETLDGSALAHAFAPMSGGDVHLLKTVNWTTTRLDLVLAHELCHALGVGHSSDAAALMYPYYHDIPVGAGRLAADDVVAVRRLYGLPIGERTSTQETFQIFTFT